MIVLGMSIWQRDGLHTYPAMMCYAVSRQLKIWPRWCGS